MKKTIYLLFLCFLCQGLCFSQTTEILGLPTPENVLGKVKGNSKLDTYTRQTGAFVVLMDIAITYMASAHVNDGMKKEIENITGQYGDKLGEILDKAKSELSQSELDKLANYISSVPQNQDLKGYVVQNLLSQRARQNLENINNPNYSFQKTTEPIVKNQKPRNKKEGGGIEFKFDDNHVLTPNPIVFDAPGVSQKDLYSRALKWIAQTYQSADDVVDFTSPNEYIKINCMEPLFDNLKSFPYTIEMEFKEGKYRLTFFSEMVNDPSRPHEDVNTLKKMDNSIESSIESGVKLSEFVTKEFILRSTPEYNNKAFAYINSLYSSLNAHLTKPVNKKDDW